jgi:hypothetical protein
MKALTVLYTLGMCLSTISLLFLWTRSFQLGIAPPTWPYASISLRKRSLGEAVMELSHTDVALVKLDEGVEFVNEPFENRVCYCLPHASAGQTHHQHVLSIAQIEAMCIFLSPPDFTIQNDQEQVKTVGVAKTPWTTSLPFMY